MVVATFQNQRWDIKGIQLNEIVYRVSLIFLFLSIHSLHSLHFFISSFLHFFPVSRSFLVCLCVINSVTSRVPLYFLF